MYARLDIRMYVCVFVYLSVCFVCVCMYVCIYIHMLVSKYAKVSLMNEC